MKKWKSFEEFLMNGAWHIHTHLTDEENSVYEYCLKASELGIPLIGFTEYVRNVLTYDFDLLRDQIEKARRIFCNLKIVLGCEVKVLNTEGELDAPYDILATSDIVFIAFHSVNFETKEKFLEALKNALRNPFTDVWAHPRLYYLRRGFILTQEEMYHIVECCKNNQVLIEVNKNITCRRKNYFLLPEFKELNSSKVVTPIR